MSLLANVCRSECSTTRRTFAAAIAGSQTRWRKLPGSIALPVGLRLAVSGNLAAGTALVGAFQRASALYRKAAMRVDLSESHDDYFTKNVTAVRAEQRELLAIMKPSGFSLVSGLVPA
jgi:hypothetical protein